MDKENVVNEMLFRYPKEPNHIICKNTEEPKRHYDK
jgi:hypothetical protein